MNELIAHLAREVAALRAELERLKTQESGSLLRSGGTMTGVLFLPNGTAGAPSVSFASDPDTGMYRYGTNGLAWATAGVIRMALDGGGKLGVNTTAQAAQVHVNSTGAAIVALLARTAASATADAFQTQNSASTVQFAVGPAGTLKTNQAANNTNTPAGATAKQLPVYDVAGTLLGYVPIYGAAW